MAEKDRARRARQSVLWDRLFVKESGFWGWFFWSVPMFYGLSLRESGNERWSRNSGFHTQHLEKILPCSLTFKITMTECDTKSFEGWGRSCSPHTGISRPASRPQGSGTMWLWQQQERVLSGPTEACSLSAVVVVIVREEREEYAFWHIEAMAYGLNAMLRMGMLSEALWRLP